MLEPAAEHVIRSREDLSLELRQNRYVGVWNRTRTDTEGFRTRTKTDSQICIGVWNRARTDSQICIGVWNRARTGTEGFGTELEQIVRYV